MPKKKAEHKYIYRQKNGWVVTITGHKSKYFRDTLEDPLQQAIQHRNQLLGHNPDKTDKPAKQTCVPWENDSRTFALQFKTLELEEDLESAQYQVKVLTEELAKNRQIVEEYRRNRKLNFGELEFERFKPNLDTVIIVDGNYLFHQAERIDLALLRKMIETMIGGRAEALIYVASLPSEGEAQRRTEGYHAFLSSVEGGGASVVANGLKETTIYCPKCNASFERRFQWAGDTVIATEITFWAYGKDIDRIILIAGDMDFTYPVQLARRKCKEVVVTGFRNSMSNRLQGAATRTLFLDEYLNVIKK